MTKRIFIAIALYSICFAQSCFGLIGQPFDKVDSPWLTGPLLTPNPRVVPPGHWQLEPYYFWTETNARYDDHWKAHSVPRFTQENYLVFYRIGVVDKIDFGGIFQGFHNRTQGESDSVFGDMNLAIEYQIYEAPKDKNSFRLKIILQETFPTGPYENLHAHKLGTDIGGTGSFVTQIGLSSGMLMYFGCDHFLSLRAYVAANIPSYVHVHGINAFGGDEDTHGTVHPGTSFLFASSMEYTLTRNWVYAMDLVGIYGDESTFHGDSVTPVGGPSFAQWSITPSLEYNFNEHVGIIVGSWFTIAGRNSSRFAGVAVALNMFY